MQDYGNFSNGPTLYQMEESVNHARFVVKTYLFFRTIRVATYSESIKNILLSVFHVTLLYKYIGSFGKLEFKFVLATDYILKRIEKVFLTIKIALCKRMRLFGTCCIGSEYSLDQTYMYSKNQSK